MKRIAALLLLALAFAVTGCSSLTEEELAQLNFIAEEALAEVSEAPVLPSTTPDEPASTAERAPATSGALKQAKTNTLASNKANSAKPLSDAQASGQTRRSVAAAVAIKIPISSQQGADTAVWQARALIDALGLDPQDRNTCFRVLNRSFFNRCAEPVSVTACQSGLCYRYQVPAGSDLTIAHDYDSLTPVFLSDAATKPAAAQPSIQPAAQPLASASPLATPQAARPASAQAKPKAAQSAAQPKAAQVAKAEPSPVPTAPATPKPEAGSAVSSQQDTNPPASPKIPRGVPQGIQPEPEGSDLASTEFFTQGGFPLTF